MIDMISNFRFGSRTNGRPLPAPEYPRLNKSSRTSPVRTSLSYLWHLLATRKTYPASAVSPLPATSMATRRMSQTTFQSLYPKLQSTFLKVTYQFLASTVTQQITHIQRIRTQGYFWHNRRRIFKEARPILPTVTSLVTSVLWRLCTTITSCLLYTATTPVFAYINIMKHIPLLSPLTSLMAKLNLYWVAQLHRLARLFICLSTRLRIWLNLTEGHTAL